MKQIISPTIAEEFKHFPRVTAQYENGNYSVIILSDGTKIRYSPDLKEGCEFKPVYPETIDVCLTRKCSQGCLFCYENCLPDGAEAPYEFCFSELWKNMSPYTEVAINGNDMDWPYLTDFLDEMKQRKAIVNITVNINQFVDNFTKLHNMQQEGKIKAIGVSVGELAEFDPVSGLFNGKVSMTKLVNMANQLENLVFHIIAGVNDSDDIIGFAEVLRQAGYKQKIKFLILGYKTVGRGVFFQTLRGQQVMDKINDIHNNFKKLTKVIDTLAFDNLALGQIRLQELMPADQWKEKFMGKDGVFSMYIDGVTGTYALNSFVHKAARQPIGGKSLKACFKTLTENNAITECSPSVSVSNNDQQQ